MPDSNLTPDEFLREAGNAPQNQELTPDAFLREAGQGPAPGSKPSDYTSFDTRTGRWSGPAVEPAPLPLAKMPIPPGLQGPPEKPVQIGPYGVPMLPPNAQIDLGPVVSGTVRNTKNLFEALAPFAGVSPEAGNAQAAPPTPADRQRLGQQAQQPIVPLSEGTEPGTVMHGIASGLASATTPANAAIIGGTMATDGALPLLSKALSVYFTAQAVGGMSEHTQAAYQAYKQGDYAAVAENLGLGSVDALFSYFGIKHTLKTPVPFRLPEMPTSQWSVGHSGGFAPPNEGAPGPFNREPVAPVENGLGSGEPSTPAPPPEAAANAPETPAPETPAPPDQAALSAAEQAAAKREAERQARQAAALDQARQNPGVTAPELQRQFRLGAGAAKAVLAQAQAERDVPRETDEPAESRSVSPQTTPEPAATPENPTIPVGSNPTPPAPAAELTPDTFLAAQDQTPAETKPAEEAEASGPQPGPIGAITQHERRTGETAHNVHWDATAMNALQDEQAQRFGLGDDWRQSAPAFKQDLVRGLARDEYVRRYGIEDLARTLIEKRDGIKLPDGPALETPETLESEAPAAPAPAPASEAPAEPTANEAPAPVAAEAPAPPETKYVLPSFVTSQYAGTKTPAAEKPTPKTLTYKDLPETYYGPDIIPPKEGELSPRQKKNLIGRTDEFLLAEAKRKVTDRYQRRQLDAINLKNLAPADRTTIRDLLGLSDDAVVDWSQGEPRLLDNPKTPAAHDETPWYLDPKQEQDWYRDALPQLGENPPTWTELGQAWKDSGERPMFKDFVSDWADRSGPGGQARQRFEESRPSAPQQTSAPAASAESADPATLTPDTFLAHTDERPASERGTPLELSGAPTKTLTRDDEDRALFDDGFEKDRESFDQLRDDAEGLAQEAARLQRLADDPATPKRNRQLAQSGLEDAQHQLKKLFTHDAPEFETAGKLLRNRLADQHGFDWLPKVQTEADAEAEDRALDEQRQREADAETAEPTQTEGAPATIKEDERPADRTPADQPRGDERPGATHPEALGDVSPAVREEPEGERPTAPAGGTGSDQPRGDVQPHEAQGPRAGSGAGDRPAVVDSPGERSGPRSGSGERAETPGDLTGQTAGNDFRITASDRIGEGTPREKLNANLDAIRLVKQIQAENRLATRDEQAKLARYVGWGGLWQIFDTWKKEYAGAREELKSLLTPEEYRAAEGSTKNAHYTSPLVIGKMWDAMRHLGLKPGASIIEPSMGIGSFFGMQPDDLLPARRTGVELDSITGQLARALYPDSNVQITGFEKLVFPQDFFDLAISNVPFGSYGVSDPKYRKNPLATHRIHNYFFVKSLDLVRPGGIVAFITSRYTMDAEGAALRKLLAQKANLVGMVRLPDTAFKGNAGTEVVTDLVILQKRAPGEGASGPNWIKTQEVDTPTGKTTVNEYYAERPHMILGELNTKGSMYAANQQNVSGELTPELLDRAIEQLPKNIFSEWKAETPSFQGEDLVHLGDEVKDGGYAEKNGVLVQREGSIYRPVPMGKTQEARVRGMIPLRGAVREVYKTQIENADEAAIAKARKDLNKVYDAFVKKFGPVSSAANSRAFGADPDYVVIAAIEKNFDKEKNTAEKMPIFSSRTIERPKPAERADSAAEALAISLNERGRLDWDRMQQLTGKTPDEMRAELKGLLYRNPEGKKWETAEEYLSGRVRDKLALARQAAKSDPAYQENVDALEKVQPVDLTPDQIKVTLGAGWIDPKYISQFLKEALDLPNSKVTYSPEVGTWSIQKPERYIANRVKNVEAGTPDFLGHELVDLALNGKKPRVTHDGELDKQATVAAQGQLEALKDKFREWLWKDKERAETLAQHYNWTANNLRSAEWDGSHLTLPGSNPAITLRPHQKNVVWRMIRTGNTLLAHEVGAGKTWEMVAGAMEMRRLGLAKKPMLVVPNHMLEQFTTEFYQLYPAARVLTIGREELGEAKRKRAMARIASGSWDAVIVAHSSFGKIPVSDATYQKHTDEQVKELETALLEAKANAKSGKEEKGDRTIKEIQKAIEKLKVRLDKYLNRENKDDGATFEQLGVDALFVDEAHCFPYETPVLTDRGVLPIGEIVENRLDVTVLSCDLATGQLVWKPVREWYRNSVSHPMVRVHHEYGYFDCTSNHQIWTEEDGYVEAGELNQMHHLRILPRAVYLPLEGSGERPEAPLLRQFVRGELAQQSTGTEGTIQAVDLAALGIDEGAEVSLSLRAHEGPQSDEGSGRAGEDAPRAEGPHVSRTGREREIDEAANDDSGDSSASHGVRHRNGFREESISEPAALLPSGSGSPGIEDGHRSGRQNPPAAALEVSGPAQDGSAERARVARVTLHQPGSAYGPAFRHHPDSRVYCLGVEDTHNFFAAGVLVSNSFKKLPIHTHRTRVAGIPTGTSQRANDMYMKTQYVSELNGGQRGVVFATGTPVTNTMAELYNMQRYLQPAALKAAGVFNFDAWANQFGEIQSGYELDVSGKGFRENERFTKFINIPELLRMFQQVADVKTADQLKLPRPELVSGAMQPITGASSPELKMYIDHLVERSEAIRSGQVDVEEDNMLKVVSEGKKAALDIRLVLPGAPDYAESKVNRAVDHLVRIYKQGSKDLSTQVVFCDLSVPLSAKRKPKKATEAAKETDGEDSEEEGRDAVPEAAGEAHFSVYDDMKAKLIKRGIPSNEIAFIHDFKTDAAKQNLFDDVNAGRVRILFGSTEKMGVGTNVQKRMIALHHMDTPWRPGDVTQRNGRIQRQGNMHPAVNIYQYLTEGSFDAYSWQLIENKARFIQAIMTGDLTLREMEDIGMMIMGADEFKAIASGDPLVKEKIMVDGQLGKLETQRISFQMKRSKAQWEMAGLPARIEQSKQEIADTERDIETVKHTEGWQIGKQTFAKDQRTEAADAIHQRLESLRGTPDDVRIGSYRGIPLMAETQKYLLSGQKVKDLDPNRYPDLRWKGEGQGISEPITTNPEKPLSAVQSMEAHARTMLGPDALAYTRRILAEDEKKQEELAPVLEAPWPMESKYQELLKRKAEIDEHFAPKEGETAALTPAPQGEAETKPESGARQQLREYRERPAAKNAPASEPEAPAESEHDRLVREQSEQQEARNRQNQKIREARKRKQRGSLPVNVGALKSLFTGRKDGEPERVYSGLGAAKSNYVRNLSQLAEASPTAHRAAVEAATARAQTAVLMRKAMPQVTKALGGQVSRDEFLATLIESRLQGIEQRWRDLVDEAQNVPKDELVDWVLNGPLQLLAAMSEDGELAQSAAALAQNLEVLPPEKTHRNAHDRLRTLVTGAFEEAADSVHHMMPDSEFTRLTSDAHFEKALSVYQKEIEPVLAESHSSNEGVFSSALGPLDTYYPLIPIRTEDQARAAMGARKPFKKPANLSNHFATGLSDDYSTGLEELSERVRRAFQTNSKAALLTALEDAGLLHTLPKGESADSVKFQGRDFAAKIVETKPEKMILENGKMVRVPATRAAIPEPFYHELKPILDANAKLPPGAASRLLNLLTQFTLAGPADAVYHAHNLIGALVANTPFLGEDLASKTIGNTPLTKTFTAITQMIYSDPMGDRATGDLREMAKLGLLPERFGRETFSKQYAEETGAELKRIWKLEFGPTLYGPKGMDVRARLVMYRTAKQINPNATSQELFAFVNQLGNYTEALQGHIERALKRSGLSPFYTAGSTMLRNGVDSILGTGAGSGPGGGSRNRLWQMLSGGALGLALAWVATYQYMTGKYPWQDRDSELLKIVAPDALRRSKIGVALWGHDFKKKGQINFSFFSPLVGRGTRALGLNGAYNTAREGGNLAQMGEAAKREVANSLIHPLAGPVVRAGVVLGTGKQPYLIHDRQGGSTLLPAVDKRAPIGSEAKSALKELNSFYGNVGAATGLLSSEDPKATWDEQLLKMLLTFTGAFSAPSNHDAARKALAQERRTHTARRR